MRESNNTIFDQWVSALITCLAVLWPLEVGAIDGKGKYIIRGIGAKDGSCGEYVRAEKEDRRWYDSWSMGYISGINRAKPGKADYSNEAAPQGLVQWIENYCKQNPLSSFGSAVDALLEELGRKK
ncbi:MAG: hypothetical protein HYY45_04215 [Deltaproteobacteria bacterium]|nr:hypothetical protein [Deltaproteobacteria bacterium]